MKSRAEGYLLHHKARYMVGAEPDSPIALVVKPPVAPGAQYVRASTKNTTTCTNQTITATVNWACSEHRENALR